MKNFTIGKFPESLIIGPNPNQLATINVMEEDGAKTVLISNRTEVADGITINMSAFQNLLPGDRLTITGRIGSNAPTAKWCMLIHRGGGNYSLLKQHSIPLHDELFYLTHLLDEVDLKYPIRLRTDHWGNEESYMDFYVDDILITRNIKNTGIIIDSRDIVYSLATDNYASDGLTPVGSNIGTVPSFLQTSGDPEYSLIEEGDKKIIYLRRRVHDWDGIDIKIGLMALKKGNSYTITIKGRPEGEVLKDAQLMMQILPGYVWRDNKNVYEGQEFILEHTLSNAEVLNAEFIRIASTPQGASMSFVITDIIIKVNKEGAA
ncbi:MAG: hypothetical protein FWE27_02840 [Defluviitaleaceae bacterium]|nr:hypothetical protein [Defluviitaleaceae bacterium]